MILEQITNAASNKLIKLNVPGLQNGIKKKMYYLGDEMCTSLYYEGWDLLCNMKNEFIFLTQGYTGKEWLFF